jgi:hypothetical protein
LRTASADEQPGTAECRPDKERPSR